MENITLKTAVLLKRKNIMSVVPNHKRNKNLDRYIWDRVEKNISPFILYWKLEERGHEKDQSYYFYPKCTQEYLRYVLRVHYNVDIIMEPDIDKDGKYYKGRVRINMLPSYIGTAADTYEKVLENLLYKTVKEL